MKTRKGFETDLEPTSGLELETTGNRARRDYQIDSRETRERCRI